MSLTGGGGGNNPLGRLGNGERQVVCCFMNHQVSFGVVPVSGGWFSSLVLVCPPPPPPASTDFNAMPPRLSKRQQRELEEISTLAAVSPVKAESGPEEEETMMASGRSGPSKAAPSAFSLVLGSFMESNRPV